MPQAKYVSVCRIFIQNFIILKLILKLQKPVWKGSFPICAFNISRMPTLRELRSRTLNSRMLSYKRQNTPIKRLVQKFVKCYSLNTLAILPFLKVLTPNSRHEVGNIHWGYTALKLPENHPNNPTVNKNLVSWNRGKSSQEIFCRHVKLERLAMKELQK